MNWAEGIAFSAVLVGLWALIFLCDAWTSERRKKEELKKHVNKDR